MTESSAHTVKSFDHDLHQLRSLISEMGGLCEAQVMASVDALIRRDSEAGRAVIAVDARIDAMEAEIERLAIQIIALRAPMAQDLREIVAALKISSILERVGDYAKNIAKRTMAVAQFSSAQPSAIIPEMAKIVASMIRETLDAFVHRDADMAMQVIHRDAAVDDLYASLFRALLTFMMEDPQHITPSTHLLFVAKNLERIGDHSTNIAEIVYFSVTGQQVLDRPKGSDVAMATSPDAS